MNSKSIYFITCILLMFHLLILPGHTIAQEIRAFGTLHHHGRSVPIYNGLGIGIENSITAKMTFITEGSMGWNRTGRSLEISPALNYYLGNDQSGFFIGSSFRYFTCNWVEGNTRMKEVMLGIGPTVGVKSTFGRYWKLLFSMGPHVSKSLLNGGVPIGGFSGQIGLGYFF